MGCNECLNFVAKLKRACGDDMSPLTLCEETKQIIGNMKGTKSKKTKVAKGGYICNCPSCGALLCNQCSRTRI